MCRYVMLILITCLAMVLFTVDASFGQSLQQRIEDRERRLEAAAAERRAQTQARPLTGRRLRQIIDNVSLDTTAREAFEAWSRQTGVPLVINWERLILEGIDPEQPVQIHLSQVPALALLELLMAQATIDPFTELVYSVTPWYVRVMSKAEANRHTVIRVYDVRDLILEIPHFDNAPEFDLGSALQDSGGGGGGGGDIFGGQGRDAGQQEQTTRTERAEQIVELIRTSIEPDIWQANGGQYASVTYLDGRLIVNAPEYVHRQIGIPAPVRRPPMVNPNYQSPRRATYGASRATGGVSGLNRSAGR